MPVVAGRFVYNVHKHVLLDTMFLEMQYFNDD